MESLGNIGGILEKILLEYTKISCYIYFNCD